MINPTPSRFRPTAPRNVNPYTAGNRVYSGATSAPNRGAVVNRTGYNQRDLRRQAQQAAMAERYRQFMKNRSA